MRAALVLPILAAMLVSCAITMDLSRSETVSAINARGRHEPARVILAGSSGGGTHEAINVRVGRDSTSWMDAATLRLTVVPTSSVEAVTFKDYGRGMIEGLSFGLLAGGAAGALLGAAQGSDPPPTIGPGRGDTIIYVFTLEWMQPRLSAGDKATLGGMAGIAVGSLIGLITGAAVGSTDRYALAPGSR